MPRRFRRILSASLIAVALAASSALPAAAADELTDETRVRAEGTLIVSESGASAAVDDFDEPQRSYRLRTADNETIALADSPVLTPAQTGDQFVGEIQLAPPSEDAMSDSQRIEPATAEVLEASVTSSLPSEGAVPTGHVSDLVVINPTGVAPAGVDDATLRSWATASGERWRVESSGRISSFALAEGVVRTTVTAGCDEEFAYFWDAAARELGYADADAYIAASTGAVRHLIVFLPSGCLPVEPTSAGSFGSTEANGMVVVTLGDSPDRTLTHELGHNIGLGDAHLAYCGPDGLVLGCNGYEKADYYDLMGQIATIDTPKVLGGAQRAQVGWFDPASTPQMELSESERSRTWRIDLAQLGVAQPGSDAQLAIVTDPITSERLAVDLPMIDGFWDDGVSIAMNWEEDFVYFAKGVRLVGLLEDGDTVVYTSPLGLRPGHAKAYSSVTAWPGDPARSDTISNPSGSVSVRVISGGTPATVEVTLTRPTDEPTKPVYRFWSDRLKAHFYTISAAERDRVIATWPETWSYEGPKYEAFDHQVAGSVPLYRFWSDRYQAHFYTIDEAEKARVLATWPDVWTYEKVAYYVYPLDSTEPNTVRMSRFWSPQNSRHFYTADPVERERVIRLWPSPIWDYEGDMFRVPLTGLGG